MKAVATRGDCLYQKQWLLVQTLAITCLHFPNCDLLHIFFLSLEEAKVAWGCYGSTESLMEVVGVNDSGYKACQLDTGDCGSYTV